MGLDDLIARRSRAAGTAGTADVPADVPANPLQTLAWTAGTAGTAEKDKGGGDSSETPTDTAPPIWATRWLLHYADREPVEVYFAPAADHVEVLVAYPDAVAAEPLPEVRTPVRNEVRMESAARGCSTCRHRKRPGLSAGYCGGGRDDLPGAYGAHHPLRQLPADQGATCASYNPHE
ncbi:hypothetical protein [Thauera aromatica]|uniref:hypothetical protein n=1 Tax=Thauera aromatica TaxID=59405 RepID=UPI00131BD130|nr:hypothetical protein [Thauera aromatica]